MVEIFWHAVLRTAESSYCMSKKPFICIYVFSPDEFGIMTNYPRRKLSCQPAAGAEPPTLSEAGFGKSEMLFVNDLEA